MVRLGGAASPTYISVFRGLQAHFRRHSIELDWVLYADYDALVEAFVKREIWNMARQRYCRQLARYRNTLRVSADPVAKPAPAHPRGKPGFSTSKAALGERRTP